MFKTSHYRSNLHQSMVDMAPRLKLTEYGRQYVILASASIAFRLSLPGWETLK
jgi:hypothetical protein